MRECALSRRKLVARTDDGKFAKNDPKTKEAAKKGGESSGKSSSGKSKSPRSK